MRNYLIAGNWKMYKTAAEGAGLVLGIVDGAKPAEDVEMLVCPPFTALPAALEAAAGSALKVGAQNMHPESEGAFTGEVSPLMLKTMGVSHVIIGHSERRQLFGEGDEFVNAKVRSAFKNGLIPIMCCGETLEQREGNLTASVVRGQVTEGLRGFSAEQVAGAVVAYEPIWAIGTGRTATPEMAQEVNGLIRTILTDLFGSEAAHSVRILYGGSVKPDNVDELMSQPDIDGALVGGASLDAASFNRLVGFQR